MGELKSVTKDHVEQILADSKITDTKMGEKTTVMVVTLPNGFEIVTSSSCVDPRNYDHALGVSICLVRAKDKVWELEGYALQSDM